MLGEIAAPCQRDRVVGRGTCAHQRQRRPGEAIAIFGHRPHRDRKEQTAILFGRAELRRTLQLPCAADDDGQIRIGMARQRAIGARHPARIAGRAAQLRKASQRRVAPGIDQHDTRGFRRDLHLQQCLLERRRIGHVGLGDRPGLTDQPPHQPGRNWQMADAGAHGRQSPACAGAVRPRLEVQPRAQRQAAAQPQHEFGRRSGASPGCDQPRLGPARRDYLARHGRKAVELALPQDDRFARARDGILPRDLLGDAARQSDAARIGRDRRADQRFAIDRQKGRDQHHQRQQAQQQRPAGARARFRCCGGHCAALWARLGPAQAKSAEIARTSALIALNR